jgi:CheY-like chemotaxis protein
MNGYEVASRLRRETECANARLIALSGYGQAEDRRRSKEAGFDFHLTKPVEPDALIALLGSLKEARG